MTKKIMIVDDEPDIRQTLKLILEKEKYIVETATDGDDCLKKLKKSKPDLILMDIMMPGTPTKKIIKKIKTTKVVFISVIRTSEAEREELINQKNVVDFIQKPFNVKEVAKRINAILK